MPRYRNYNAAITIEATDWLRLHPDPGTYPMGELGRGVMILHNRRTMPGTFPMTKPRRGYLDAVEGHLDTLCRAQIGRDLMTALIATAHVVTIRPPGKTVMTMSRNAGASISQTNANFDDAYVLLVRHLRNGNAVAARTELQHAMDAAALMGHDANALSAIIAQRVQSYNAQHCLNGVGGAPVGIAQRVLNNVTGADITNMYNGPAALVDSREVRYLALALEPFLTRGAGTDVSIVFDPWAYGLGMLARPPFISLGHEMLHALDAMRGTRIFDNDPEEECIYIPCGNFGHLACTGTARRFTENAIRAALGEGTRVNI